MKESARCCIWKLCNTVLAARVRIRTCPVFRLSSPGWVVGRHLRKGRALTVPYSTQKPKASRRRKTLRGRVSLSDSKPQRRAKPAVPNGRESKTPTITVRRQWPVSWLALLLAREISQRRKIETHKKEAKAKIRTLT